MPLSWREYFYPQVSSTMDRARELVLRVPADTAVFTVRTGHQLQGRGRRGNGWHEDPGSSVLMTLAIRRGGRWDPRDSLASTLALRTAAAVFHTVHQHAYQQVGEQLQIKWPNDILLGGRKLCGILLEAVPEWFLVGIGLNLRPPRDITLGSDDLSPTGLYQLPPADSPRLWYGRIAQGLGRHLSGDRWRETVQAALAWKGAAVEVRCAGSVQAGILDGVDLQGGLLLRDSQTGALLSPLFSGTVRLKGIRSSAAT